MFNASMLTKSLANNPDQDYVKLVGQAIDAGLSPWKTGEITVYSTDEFYKHGFTLTFFIERLPRLPFSANLEKRRIVAMNPAEAFLDIAQEAFKFYRYRPALPVDDHIILGEE